MGLKIKQPGIHATIQDIGRTGAQKYGVVVGGVMDELSLRIGNILVQNNQNEAAIEIMFFGTSITFTADHVIAITGGNLHPMMNGALVPMWRPIYIKKSSTITFKGTAKGCFTYISIAGGFEIPKEMDSKSTFIKAGIGGYKGRALEKNDVLEVGSPNKASKIIMKALKQSSVNPKWYVNHTAFYGQSDEQVIRVLKGSEYDLFSEESQKIFKAEAYTLTTQADRMGYKFDGQTLKQSNPVNLLSEGVTYGTVQVPANGKPIILMADRQTTGGYPKIAQVITADLPKLAQVQPNSKVRFEIVSMLEAEKVLFAQEDRIKEISLGVYLKAKTGGILQ